MDYIYSVVVANMEDYSVEVESFPFIDTAREYLKTIFDAYRKTIEENENTKLCGFNYSESAGKAKIVYNRNGSTKPIAWVFKIVKNTVHPTAIV